MSNALTTEKKLSAKHRTFIDELFKNNHNATKAYEITYGTENGTARANGAKLLAKTSIKSEIESRLQENTMEVNEVLSRLADHARGDIGEFAAFIHPKNFMLEQASLSLK